MQIGFHLAQHAQIKDSFLDYSHIALEHLKSQGSDCRIELIYHKQWTDEYFKFMGLEIFHHPIEAVSFPGKAAVPHEWFG